MNRYSKLQKIADDFGIFYLIKSYDVHCGMYQGALTKRRTPSCPCRGAQKKKLVCHPCLALRYPPDMENRHFVDVDRIKYMNTYFLVAQKEKHTRPILDSSKSRPCPHKSTVVFVASCVSSEFR